MKTAEQKFNETIEKANELISELEDLFADMPSKGDTAKDCQRQLLYDKIKSLEHAVSGIAVDDFKVWECTDPDNEQYGRKISEGVYEFKEKDHHSESDDDYVEMTITMSNYTPEQIADYISGYYPSMAVLELSYGDDSEFIIAECIFEQESGLY